jgi:flagellar basal body-associated protein FliL
MAELQNPEVEDQAALPPKKDGRGFGGGNMSTSSMLIVIAVVAVILVVGLILSINVMVTSVMEKKMGEAGLDTTSVFNRVNEENDLYLKKIQEQMALEEVLDQLEKEDFYVGDEGVMYAEIADILAMPKGSDDKVMIAIGIEYRMKTEASEEQEDEDEDNVDPTALFKQKPQLKAKIESNINNLIGSMNLDELQAVRPELEDVLTDRLKPIFKSERIWLRKVMVRKFIFA